MTATEKRSGRDPEVLAFGSFRLDLRNEQLWRGKVEVRLRPKPFSVLSYLVQHPGELVTKDALIERLWPELHVSDGVLVEYMSEIRRALKDNPKKPRYIETIHRRGYRFIALVGDGDRLLGRPNVEDLSLGSASGEEAPIRLSTATNLLELQSLVGRGRELSFLKERLDLATQAQGNVVFVSGQAGVGKTRLAREIQRYAERRSCHWLEGKYEKTSRQPHKAWSDIVRSYLLQAKAAPLQDILTEHRSSLAKIVPEMIEDVSDSTEAIRGDPEREQIRLVEGLTQFFMQISDTAPLVLFLDDLQWATSLDLLHYLSRKIANQRLLVLAACRDDERKESRVSETILEMNRERLFHSLPINPLDQQETGKLMSQKIRGSIDSGFREVIYEKTAGNPFFVEEMLSLLQHRNELIQTEAGWRIKEATELPIPESIKAVINQRLSHAGKDVEEALRIASVVGREFPLALLGDLVDENPEEFIELIDGAEQADLVAPRSSPGAEVYSFVHDLIQEVLYQSIGTARRRRYHMRVGQAIEKRFSTRLQDWYDALAYQYSHSVDVKKAVEYLTLAGRQAGRRSAYQEALAYFEQARVALEGLPRDQGAVEQAVAVRVDLAALLIAAKGYSAPEVEKTYGEAWKLTDQLDDGSLRFPILWGMGRLYYYRGDLKEARRLGEELLSIAEQSEDRSLILEAHHTLWTTSLTLGELVSTQLHCEKGIMLYDARHHRDLAFQYGGHDSGVCGLGHAARVLWLLGYPDQALGKSQDALTLGGKISHPHSLGYGLGAAIWVHQQRGEQQAALDYAEATLGLGKRHGISRWVRLGAFAQACLRGDQDKLKQRLSQMHKRAAGTAYPRAQIYNGVLIAQAYLEVGRADQALKVIGEALTEMRKTGTCFFEAELHRIKGESLLAQNIPASDQAKSCFQKAINVAHRQRAKSLELRAVTSMSRLLYQKGKTDEARQILAEIYGWFTEGFDTADLKEAKALLDDLC